MSDDVERLRSALADRYRIERELGTGGMATVYLAHDLRHDRDVALKVLRSDLAATLGAERFQREIQIAARLQHPNILPLLDSGEAAGFLYYVMPFVEGESLRERLAREGALPVGDVVRITRDVVDALTEAHAHGVVHRDIKPENILLRGRHALVADFGVAKAVREATGRQTLTTVGVALGTPAYMAPEQASADPHVDHRADIYTTGAVAYELLTGRPVFMGTTPQMVLAAHVSEAPVPISKHRESVPRALEALVLRCLAKQPADRWQSAAELLAQLEALATPRGGLTPLETQPVPAAPGARRRLLPVALAIAAIAVLMAAVALWRSPARRPTPELTRLQLTSSGAAVYPVISPDGSQIAYETRRCPEAAACAWDLVVRDIATEAEQTIVQGAHWVAPVRYSPDGARILILASLPGEGEGAFLVPRSGGALTRLFASSDSLYGIDFLPGGDTVLAQVGNTLRPVLVASGQVLRTVPLPASFGAALEGVSADGRWLSFERPPDYYGATTLLIAERSGRVVDSLSAPVLAGSARWSGARTLLGLEGRVRIAAEKPLLRWALSSRTGRVGDPDTVLMVHSWDPPDISADGRSLVFASLSAGELELWTLEPGPGMALRPVRKVLGSTTSLTGRMAADGRTLAYMVGSGGARGSNLQVFVQDFAGGRARPVTPLLPEADYLDLTMSAYGDRMYLATRAGGRAARVVSYDVATGRAQPFAELPSPDVLLWARPGGGFLWHDSGAGDTLHVVDGEGRVIGQWPDPAPAIPSPMTPVFSPDGSEVVLQYWEPAAGERTHSGVVLYILSLADGRVRLAGRMPTVGLSPVPMWGSDGWIRVEATTPQDPRWMIHRVPAAGGEFEPEFVTPFENECNCSMSYDAKRWVGVDRGIRSDIVLVRDFDRSR
ncbi:MAG: hypothetical protein FIB01_11980 [Gemmatimonadetes bacterium]|nr:hypothetical protein [Gemmatimonadota bacterium]